MTALLNPEAVVRIQRQGREQQPVIVIDTMLADPKGWRDMACQLHDQPIGPYYPGVRAPNRSGPEGVA